MAATKRTSSAASSRSGASLPTWRVTCASAEAPRRWRPWPRSTRISTESTPRASCGVSVRRTSLTGANAVTTSETGALTDFSRPPAAGSPGTASRQTVRIDRESLPTGIDTPICRHSPAAASTASNRSASSCAVPQAAIQLAESLMSSIDPMGAAARLVTASAIAMREAARGSITASGVRSPIASASPR